MSGIVDVILNPAAGGGAGRKLRAEIEHELAARGAQVRVHETTGVGSAEDLARSLASAGATLLVAAGGDGTIHGVANGILAANAAGADAALGLIPAGTGNDFVKMVPGTRQRPRAYDTLVNGVVRRFDVGLVTWANGREYFVNGMGTGIDVEVVRQLTSLPRLPGPLKYLLALLQAVVGFQPIGLRATIDGRPIERRVMIVAVGNGVCQGGGFYLAPAARADDGLLDVCIVNALRLPGIARVIPKVMRGTQEGDSEVSMQSGRRIALEALDGRPLFFHLDGELREPPGLSRLDVEVVPGALAVLAGVEE